MLKETETTQGPIKLKLDRNTLYPKTKRVGGKESVIITEKLDGSNLGIFKHNNRLLIAQRNNVFYWEPNMISDKHERGKLYKGLWQWLEDFGEALLEAMHPDSGMFGEWIGMGQIKYNRLDKRFYIFAKANITDELNAKNIQYNPRLFKYPFTEQVIPDYIGVVPVVEQLREMPTVEYLDELYINYVKTVNEEAGLPVDEENIEVDINILPHKVEGFIINNANAITKYVRLKRGKLTEHQLPKE